MDHLLSHCAHPGASPLINTWKKPTVEVHKGKGMRSLLGAGDAVLQRTAEEQMSQDTTPR